MNDFIVESLKKAMNKKDMKKCELAEKANLSKQAISKIFNCGGFSLKSLTRICNALDLVIVLKEKEQAK